MKHGQEEAKEEKKRSWGIPVAGGMALAGLYILKGLATAILL
jgi:hypothetical protein